MYPVGRPLFLNRCSITAPRLADTLPKTTGRASELRSRSRASGSQAQRLPDATGSAAPEAPAPWVVDVARARGARTSGEASVRFRAHPPPIVACKGSQDP